VVLRPTEAVPDVHAHLRSLVKAQLPQGEVSYPAQPHVTLSGFPRGTQLESVREVVAEWAPSVAPLLLEVERASCFPSPFQIVILQIRRTTELFEALASLRTRATQRELGDVLGVPPADWIFHMSVAYCSSLDSSSWAALAQFVKDVSVQAAQCVVAEVEIVAFDKGQEYSGGTFELSASASAPVAGPQRFRR
jgi:2'-5' RNA ligase